VTTFDEVGVLRYRLDASNGLNSLIGLGRGGPLRLTRVDGGAAGEQIVDRYVRVLMDGLRTD
jgi:hypothetical protein